MTSSVTSPWSQVYMMVLEARPKNSRCETRLPPPSPPRTHMSMCMCLCVYGLHDVQPAYLFKEIFDLSHSVLWMPFHVNKIKCPSALSLYSFHTPVHALVSHFPKSTAEVIPAGSTQGQCFRHIRKLIYRIITCNSIV